MEKYRVMFMAVILSVLVALPTFAQYSGEAWVVHQGLSGKPAVIKVGPNGAVDPNEIAGFEQPSGVAVNGRDGSFWVVDAAGQIVIKFQVNGAIAFQVTDLHKPESISLNPTDGSAWIGNADNAVKVSAEGKIVATVPNLQEAKVAVNMTDGSCWITSADGRVGLYDANGQLIANSAVTFKEPKGVAVDPNDGSAWVTDNQENLIVKLNRAGQEIARVTDVQLPVSPAVDPRDGSCWVIDSQNAQIVKLSATGQRLGATGGFFAPVALAVDGKDGSVLVVDSMADPMTGLGAVIKLDTNDQVVWRAQGLVSPTQVALGYWKGQ